MKILRLGDTGWPSDGYRGPEKLRQELAILLDTTTRSTNTFCGVNFQCDSQVPEEEGQMVSATATNVATGDTSGFSANETVFQP